MSKLDFKTNLYLTVCKAKILDYNSINEINIKKPNPYEIYVFENFDEYVNYYKKYLKEVDEDRIKNAICTINKKGQVVAYKALCEKMIIYFKTKEFYDSIDQKKIDEIHSKGKITASEKFEEYKSFDLCAMGAASGYAKDRCEFFDSCDECLKEFLSHNEEYDRIQLKLVNKS